ncbi:MAG: TOMM precursor leader peptide-binding protein [Streptosporangiaceae bacterium]|nr:TOMM precursor leader peptide-binding protein [Streptosporangiaceae bacterium]
MATAIRLGSLYVVASQDFGHRVARFLAEEFPGSRETGADDLASAFTGDATAIVVVVPRPAWALCERADQWAYEHGRPWLPVVMEHPVLRVGPLVCPPSGPCFKCYRARRFQHDTEYAASAVLNAAYDLDAALSPTGYLPHHARLAAAVATQFLTNAETGVVFAFDVLSGRIGAHRVISCHDCEREQHSGDPHLPFDLAGITMSAAVRS